MDARDALRTLIRAEISHDLDEFAAEFRDTALQVAALETMVGLPTHGSPGASVVRGSRNCARRLFESVDRGHAAGLRQDVNRDLRDSSSPARMLVGLDNRPVKGHGGPAVAANGNGSQPTPRVQ